MILLVDKAHERSDKFCGAKSDMAAMEAAARALRNGMSFPIQMAKDLAKSLSARG